MKLVLSGGGIKSICAVGALEEVCKHTAFTHITATSAGSIIAALFCCGVSPRKMFELLKNIKLPEFDSLSFVNLMDRLGMAPSIDLECTIEDALEECEIPLNLTLFQLYRKSGVFLEICGFNMQKQKTVYFSHNNYPEMPLQKALLISCNIPILFEPVEFQGDLYIDGGVLDNYPLAHYGYDDPDVIGIRVFSRHDHDLESFDGFISCIAEAVLRGNDDCQSRYNAEHSIEIMINNVSLVDFDLEPEEFEQMFQMGKQQAMSYFENKHQVQFTQTASAEKMQFQFY
jgi:predicted acylesterase/phospholipase RssA